MDQDSSHMVAASKVPMLKPVMPITTAEEKAQRRLENAKKLLEVVEKRFGGNAATRKTQRNLLKEHQYENITDPSSRFADKTFDSIKSLLSIGCDPSTTTSRCMNHEPEVKGCLAQVQATQHGFVSLNNKLSALMNPKLSATTAIRGDILLGSAKLHEIKTTRTRKAQEGVCLWKHQLLQLWCHVMVLVDMTRVIRQMKGLIMHSWLSHLQILTQSINKLIEFRWFDNYKKGLGYENYNTVPPPYTGNFIPPTPDLSFTGLDEFVNKPVVENCKAMSSEEEHKVVKKNDDDLCIEEWVSDDEDEDVSQPKIEKKIVRPSIVKKEFVKSKQQEKLLGKTDKQAEQHKAKQLTSQENDTVIKKLKERTKSLSENMNDDKVKKDLEEIETINIELDHREQGLIVTTLKDELRKLKGKDLADNVVCNTLRSEMLKIDVESLNPRMLNNRSAHSDYLKHTQAEAAILKKKYVNLEGGLDAAQRGEAGVRWKRGCDAWMEGVRWEWRSAVDQSDGVRERRGVLKFFLIFDYRLSVMIGCVVGIWREKRVVERAESGSM
ncbi:hypothetical protein Tco_0339309 [Tanacetum coccineum]